MFFHKVHTASSFQLIKKRPGQSRSGERSVDGAVILDIDRNQLQQIISQKDNRINISFPVSVNNNIDLILERFDITDEKTKIVSGTSRGDVEVNIKDRFASYRGNIKGIGNSLVSISFSSDRVVGLVTSGSETYVLGKLNETPSSSYVLYQASRLKITRDFKCGSDAFEIPERIRQIQNSLSGNFQLQQVIYSEPILQLNLIMRHS
jgi:hypothetical protein